MDMSCYTHHAAEEHRSASRCSDLLTVDAHGGLSADVRENGLMLAMDVSQGVADQVDVRSSQGFHLAALVLLLALASLLLLAPAAAYATHGVGSLPCDKCHRPHMATIGDGLLYVGDPDLIEGAGVTTQTEICMFCHAVGKDGATKEIDDIGLASGHSVESTTTDPDLTNECSGCHDPHAETAKLPQMTINGWTINTAVDPNSWCRACHDPDSDATDAAGLTPDANWSGVTEDDYYDQIFTSREDDTYIGSGTFRGWTAYENTSAHASIEASPTAGRAKGDCLWCHERHSSTSTYDNLIAEFGPTSKAACDECHDDHLALDPAGDWGTGHFVEQGPAVPTGDLDGKIPLPCYECHNAHGSRNGNAVLGQDSLGANLDPSTPAGQSAFCYTCHLSSDGLGWNSWANDGAGAMQTYAQLVTAAGTSDITTAVAGLPRTEMVQLPSRIKAHDSSEMDKLGCKCHGSVHAPNPKGVPAGGVDCYSCHATYESYMEDGGGNSTTVYHHVMGLGSGEGGTAFAAGSYPTSTSDLYCMSCHADHDQFNSDQAANLRLNLGAAATTSTTDYVSTGTYGICVSCHSSSLTKDTANQASDGLADTDTPKIVGGTGAGGFGTLGGVVAHNYVAGSTFGDLTTFGANCSKCHNDEQAKEFQTSDDRFGTHYSAARRLLSALGGTVSDPLAESHCYRCHSEAGDLTGGKTVAEAGRDWYDAADMSAAAEDVYDQFQLAGSSHPVAATVSGSVECESCHNVHVVRNTAGSFVSDPYNTYNLAAYSTTAEQAAYCLNCHDPNGGPTRQVDNSIYIPYSVSLSATGMDKTTYAATGHWSASGAISAGETKSCAICHDNHGSDYAKLLGVRTATGNTVNGQAITGNDNTVCYACHTSASTDYPTFARLTNGYPDTGTWPGSSTYTNATNGIHRALLGGVAGTTLPGYPTAGDCKVCHNVHGTANTYDVLNATYTRTSFALCFSCHDTDGPASDNIAQWYPAASGGTASNTTRRYGHKTVEAGTLPAGSSLPCYDCHNPHGANDVYGLMVVTQTGPGTTVVVGDAVGEIDMSTNVGDRRFCFTCHVCGDTNNGWNGAAYAAVSAGAQFEGLDRLTQLKLSSRVPHNQTDTRTCYQCHNNPHWPE